MPVVFRHKGFRFLLYTNEVSPREPMPIHVLRDGIDAEFRLWPEVQPAYNDGFDARTLRKLTDLIEQRRNEIARAWDESFSES